MPTNGPICSFCGSEARVRQLQRGVITCERCYDGACVLLRQVRRDNDSEMAALSQQLDVITKARMDTVALSIKPSIFRFNPDEIDEAERTFKEQIEDFKNTLVGTWPTEPLEYKPVTTSGRAADTVASTTYEMLTRAAAAMGLTPGAFLSVDPPALNGAPKVVREAEPEARQDFTRPIEFEE